MPRMRKFIGFWIILIAFGSIIPGTFYLFSTWLDQLFGFPSFLMEPNNIFASAFVIIIGAFWVSWAYSYLHFVGMGSPVEAFGRALYPTQKLVTTGPYAYTRNPMLFGLLFILLAISLYANSISGLILIPVLALLAILYLRMFEEPGLVKRFGEDYIKYRKAVPVLFPRLRPYTGA